MEGSWYFFEPMGTSSGPRASAFEGRLCRALSPYDMLDETPARIGYFTYNTVHIHVAHTMRLYICNKPTLISIPHFLSEYNVGS